MTLNIAVAHPQCVYIAADFRLSRMIGRQTSPMDEPSMKVVRFSYPACSGMITYTGFGAGRDGADTAVHITRWLDGKRDLDIADVAEILREKGDAWLRRLRPFPFKHTFLIAAFRADVEAVLAIVSNFQSMDGPRRAQPSASLNVSIEATRSRAIVRTTGVPGAVPRERERLLRRTTDGNALDSARIKRAMMGIIERAGTSPTNGGLISVQSNAVSLLPGGSGRYDFSEPMAVELHVIVNGTILPGVASLSSNLGPRNLRVAESLFLYEESAPYYQERCRPSRYEGSGTNAYELIELVIPGYPPYFGRAIDSRGTILAASTIGDNAAHRQYWLCTPPDNVERIPLPEPTAGDAGGFDARGYVYLSVGMPGQAQALARWNGTELTLLPRVHNYGSAASWISPSGWLAGHVEVSDDYTRADRQRPARWNPNGLLEQAIDFPDGVAGVATSIAADGTALVQLRRDFERLGSHIWHPDGSIRSLQLPIESIATGITDAHVIIGFREDSRGRIAIVSKDISAWSDLGTPQRWEPTRVASDGTVVGFTRTEGFLRPWIRQLDGTSMTLPGYHRHQCSVEGLSPNGDLVGTAHADHCSHALLWKERV
jgi:hypothetical protein